MTFRLTDFFSGDELARFTVPDFPRLTEHLLKSGVHGLSATLIECLMWHIERYPDEPACYGTFTLRRAE